MSLTSPTFLVAFLPAAVLLHWLAPARARNGVLAASSLVFLAWAGPLFLLPLLAVAVVDWSCGRVMARGDLDPGRPRSSAQRLALAASLSVNVGLLVGFKLLGPAL